MTLTIEINLDNQAFEHFADEEVTRILKNYALKLCLDGDFNSILHDVNGNVVGSTKLTGPSLHGKSRS